MQMHYERIGQGKPLLLIHGIGGNCKSWDPIINQLALQREVIAIDLPGHGKTPALKGEVSIRTLADAVTLFLQESNMTGIDTVGSSMGGRLVLELFRRGGVLGAVVSLDPGGFWKGWEIPFFTTALQPLYALCGYCNPLCLAFLKVLLADHCYCCNFPKNLRDFPHNWY